MLVASAALLILLGVAVCGIYWAPLCYHAALFRNGKDPEGAHLGRAARSLVKRNASRKIVVWFLGKPSAEGSTNGKSELIFQYPSHSCYCFIEFQRNCAVEYATNSVDPR